MTPPPTNPLARSIGVWSSVLAPKERQKHLSQMFKEATGKTEYVPKAIASPQETQCWYRAKVAPELR